MLMAGETQFLVVAWPCFWWFDEYGRWSQFLRRAGGCMLFNDVVAVFDLEKLATLPAAPIERDSTTIAEGGVDHA
jgi:hypothetical protein